MPLNFTLKGKHNAGKTFLGEKYAFFPPVVVGLKNFYSMIGSI